MKGRVLSVNSDLNTMKEGFSFFESWCKDLIDQDLDVDQPSQKEFLSWQVIILELS